MSPRTGWRRRVLVPVALFATAGGWACGAFSTSDVVEPAIDGGPDSVTVEGGADTSAVEDGGPSVKVCPDGANMQSFTAKGATFCIDKAEVTVKAYRSFFDTTPSETVASLRTSAAVPKSCDDAMLDPGMTTSDDSQPVRLVSFCSASIFCAGVGKRICGSLSGDGAPVTHRQDLTQLNDHEWVVACTGNFTHTRPWANGADAGCRLRNDAGPRPVGADSTCGDEHGVVDQIGNVWEWVSERADVDGGASYTRIFGGGYDSPDVPTCTVDHGVDAPGGKWAAGRAMVGFRCCATPR